MRRRSSEAVEHSCSWLLDAPEAHGRAAVDHVGGGPAQEGRLQAQGQNLVSQGRSIGSRESELAHERRDLVTADSELLSIHVSSWNVGNAAPPEDLRLWLPRGGGGADIVAVGVQEATYSDPQASEDASGTLRMTVKEIRGLEGGGGGPHRVRGHAGDVPRHGRRCGALQRREVASATVRPADARSPPRGGPDDGGRCAVATAR